MERLTLNHVWKQKVIPVVLRRIGRGEKIRVRLPFSDDNRQWLQNGRRTILEWIGGDRPLGTAEVLVQTREVAHDLQEALVLDLIFQQPEQGIPGRFGRRTFLCLRHAASLAVLSSSRLERCSIGDYSIAMTHEPAVGNQKTRTTALHQPDSDDLKILWQVYI